MIKKFHAVSGAFPFPRAKYPSSSQTVVCQRSGRIVVRIFHGHYCDLWTIEIIFCTPLLKWLIDCANPKFKWTITSIRMPITHSGMAISTSDFHRAFATETATDVGILIYEFDTLQSRSGFISRRSRRYYCVEQSVDYSTRNSPIQESASEIPLSVVLCYPCILSCYMSILYGSTGLPFL